MHAYSRVNYVPIVVFRGELCSYLILPEMLVLVGGAIRPAPAVSASTMISARLKRVQEHSSPVNKVLGSSPHTVRCITPPSHPKHRWQGFCYRNRKQTERWFWGPKGVGIKGGGV